MTRLPRLLAIMGSGETAPTMTKVHRALLDRLGPVEAVLLDTPYGFQENAGDISKRTITYFSRNLGVDLRIARWPSASVSPLEREQALAAIRSADYVFAGPGSPSYALGVWRETALRDVLTAKLRQGGCVTFASAAALTLGVVALPVYEVYKVGTPPHWLPGLDVLAEIGLTVAVIPHYDNAEGGTHDTRFCYLGERRLRMIEPDLPEEAFVLGVDEHTACVLDLDARTMTVMGRGTVTVRRGGASTAFPTARSMPLDELVSVARSERPPAVTALPTPEQSAASREIPSLRGEGSRLERAFDDALRSKDVEAATTAVLQLEQVLFEWAADMEAGDIELARAALRGMVVRLGAAAVGGVRDPRESMASLVDGLVRLRDQARAERSWVLADAVRDQLTASGVELRDTPEGTTWSFRPG